MPYTDSQLGLITSPFINLFTGLGLSYWEQKKIESLVPDFPEVFERARVDYAKFWAGSKKALFSRQEWSEASEWFLAFPELWETIKGNFADDPVFSERVDSFVARIRSDLPDVSMGIPPVLIAGVLLVGGAAAGLWAYAYIKKQNNLSAMIDGVTAGRIDQEVLTEALKADADSGFFGPISSALGPLAFVMAAFLVYKVTR